MSAGRPGGLGDLPLADSNPNPVLAVDESGRIAYVNPRVEAAFGWTPEELVGSPVERLLPESLAAVHVEHRARFAKAPAARPMGVGRDLLARRRDGGEFPVEISLAPLTTATGERLIFATIVDITARKALEFQLLQAQKMESIGRLAGGIAHDFNNMLFAIRGYAELLLEDLETAPDEVIDRRLLIANVDGITKAADQAAAITRQLLAFSRHTVVRTDAVDVRAAIQKVEPMLHRLIGENIGLTLALDPATGAVRADSGQLDQIIVNLVVNARDALPGGGRITVETRNVDFDEAYAIEHFEVKPGSYVMVAVSDNGHGMDRETRRHVFEPFFTTKEAGKGTGLGLSTIYGIVRQAAGHIWLYSEPGHGTTFKVYLPRLADPAGAPAQVLSPETKTHAGVVLLAEDEPSVRDLSRQVLERTGFEVLAPETSAEALAIVEATGTHLDILVADVVMPGLLGPDLARAALAIRPSLGVVLVSGYVAESVQIDDLLPQGVRFASKPLAPRDLVQLVDGAIGARETARAELSARESGPAGNA